MLHPFLGRRPRRLALTAVLSAGLAGAELGATTPPGDAAPAAARGAVPAVNEQPPQRDATGPDAAESARTAAPTGLRAALAKRLERAPAQRLHRHERVRTLTREVYGDEFTPRWTEATGLAQDAPDALALLRRSPRHGLIADEYGIDTLRRLRRRLESPRSFTDPARPELLARFDVLLTAGLLAYALDQLDGRIEPQEVSAAGVAVHLRAPERDLAAIVRASDAVQQLAGLAPDHPGYRRLQQLLARYREAEAWPRIPEGPLLEGGVEDDRVPRVRARLRAEGFGATTPVPPAEPRRYGVPLAASVRRFQARHGLKVDGIVGPKTRAAMNESRARRIARIRLNMDRWRWIDREPGSRWIQVNLPAYRLTLHERGAPRLDMNVVVGEVMTPTPVFADRLEHLVLAPYWRIPRSIATEEILPRVQEDPGYLRERDMEVLDDGRVVDPRRVEWSDLDAANFPYRLRQRPGAENSLGRIKFMFPNSYAIYLHDTPAKALLERDRRTFSHGCIRVAQPVRLAERLLEQQPEWDVPRIRREMHRREPVTVPLAQPVPVYIVYHTVTVDADGRARFLRDIYGHDRTALDLLAKEKEGSEA